MLKDLRKVCVVSQAVFSMLGLKVEICFSVNKKNETLYSNCSLQ